MQSIRVDDAVTGAVLEVRDLSVRLNTLPAPKTVVQGVSFAIPKAGSLGIVGESGCGKSLTALSISRLTPPGLARLTGEINFRTASGDTVNTAALPEGAKRLEALRGAEIGYVFQEPMSALNPVIRIGDQIAETIRRHWGLGRAEALDRAEDLLDRVRIPDPKRRLRDYPHMLSGGMRQRVVIAIALACDPRLLIADEPTTALDVTIQAQILDLIAGLREEGGMALALISHDFGVVAEVCNHVVVMYLGHVVESAPVAEILDAPRHPYTRGLLAARPTLGERTPLVPIPGTVPGSIDGVRGCRFAGRCPVEMPRCAAEPPPMVDLGGGHVVRCWQET